MIIKDAYTARELAALQLDGWPQSQRAYEIRTRREQWVSRPRNAVGGGVEYPHFTLPRDLQQAILAKATAETPIAAMPGMATPEKLTDQQFTARALIVQQFRKYRAARAVSQTAAMRDYPPFYAALAVQHPHELPYNVYSSICERSLYRWLKAQPEDLAGKYGTRKGTSVLKRAEGGAVNTYIAGLMVENRHYKGSHIRDAVRAKFGKLLEVDGKKVELPVLRSFERHVQEWKDENAQLFTAITAPGEFKNRMRIAVGTADARIHRLNQQWQIDASPADALCKDGRYSIYAIIDVWSRRAMFSVSKTAKTEGSLLLVRKAIMAWGFPESIKTDNGSDFISNRFKLALLALGIEQEISPPFSPEKKAYVERVIGSMQRDLMAILPGFAGHNVADRKRIQDQKDFAKRLGESDASAFSVELTAAELQQKLDDWAFGKYANTEHGTTRETPALMAASWTGSIRMAASERSLDVLLAPLATGGGMRTVTKSGIRIDGMHFMSAEAIPFIGKEVLVRHDPADMGRIYGFDDRDNFLFVAINHEVLGINPVVFARELKAAQNAFIAEGKAPINKERRSMDRKSIADAILASHQQTKIEAMPRPVETYSTHAMDEAARAVTRTATPMRSAEEAKAQQERTRARMLANAQPQEDLHHQSTSRYRARLEEILQQRENGEEVTEENNLWFESNQASAWFKHHLRKREQEKQPTQ